MEIDWFTFVAQIINFLILMALLKRFLYRPILRAMERREQTIADQVQEASQKTQEAQQEAERYRQKQQEWDMQREALFAQVTSEVENWKKTLFQRAREDVEQSQVRWQQSLRLQQQSFLQHLQQEACWQVSTTVRRVLADLANTDLEQQMVETFLNHLQHLKPEEQQALCTAASRNHQADTETKQPVSQITVQSAFDLPETTRQRIDRAVQEHVNSPVNLRFKTIPDLICGIELNAKGCKLAWSMENYLNTLEESLTNLFAEETQSDEPS